MLPLSFTNAIIKAINRNKLNTNTWSFGGGIGMLILCSNGLSSDALKSEMLKYVAKLTKAALVVTADNEYKENNYHIPRCVEELKQLGLTTDIIDIDNSDPNILLQYDLVEFIGGNPFYLIDSIRRNCAQGILKIISAEKILVGWSASAFVFGPTLDLVNEYTPEMNIVGLTDLSGLNLTDVEVLPHYSRFVSRFNNFEERCVKYEKSHLKSVTRLNDGDGIFIDCDTKIHIRA